VATKRIVRKSTADRSAGALSARQAVSPAALKKLGLAVHWHAAPACSGSNHAPSCSRRGTEIQCVRLAPSIKGVKLELCACAHRT
jgi:hypothetical protein